MVEPRRRRKPVCVALAACYPETHSPPAPALYDRDIHAWANERAAVLRTGNLPAADTAHSAEEIESMGKTEKRELINRLGANPGRMEGNILESRAGAEAAGAVVDRMADDAEAGDASGRLKGSFQGEERQEGDISRP